MKKLSIKRDDKAFTLIEAIITFAILGIVSIAVVGMMSMGMRSFRATSAQVGLQYEYQVVMTQLREYIIDCNAGVTFEDNVLYIVTKTEEIVGDPMDVPPVVNNIFTTYAFVFDPPSGTLYLMEPVIGEAPAHAPNVPPDIDIDITDTGRFFELSTGMTDFIITVNTPDESKETAISVTADMGFVSASGERTYRSAQDIAMRNRVKTVNLDEVSSDYYSQLQFLLDLR